MPCSPRCASVCCPSYLATPDRSFYANEVIALAQSGTGAVQRELADLSAAGLLTVTKQGNQKHYQANANAPVFTELHSLVLRRDVGIFSILRLLRILRILRLLRILPLIKLPCNATSTKSSANSATTSS